MLAETGVFLCNLIKSFLRHMAGCGVACGDSCGVWHGGRRWPQLRIGTIKLGWLITRIILECIHICECRHISGEGGIRLIFVGLCPKCERWRGKSSESDIFPIAIETSSSSKIGFQGSVDWFEMHGFSHNAPSAMAFRVFVRECINNTRNLQ